jgi:hypothetical protein
MSQSQRTYYQDYTNSGIKQFEQTDIYQKAINVGERRVVEDPRPSYPNYQRRTVRNVEVPFSRQVRVPTVERKLVPTKTTMKVPVKKMVEVPSYRIVDEEYTEWEPQEKVREKEIWVKKIVQEKYMENVPVKRVRQVRVPHKELQEVEELQDVQVETTQAVQVPGFRVDEVQDSKVVEVEELEDMRWEAEPTGDHALSKTTEGPIIPGPTYSRKEGSERYEYGDPKVAHLETDIVRSNEYDQTYRSSRQQQPRWRGQETLKYTRPQSAPFYRKNDLKDTTRAPAPTWAPSQPMRPLEEPPTSNGAYGWQTTSQAANGWFKEAPKEDPRLHPAAGEYSSKRSLGDSRAKQLQRFGGQKSKGIGMVVKSTATHHTDSYGVYVTKVNGNSAAAHAGLRTNDVIIQCQGSPTTTVEELGQAIQSAKGGPLRMLVNRDGVRGMEVIVNQN